MKFMPPLPIIGAMLAALAAIGAVAWIAWNSIDQSRMASSNAAPATARPAVTIGGPFQLIDHNGKPASDSDYRGRFMLIYFGYGYCPDVCPTELANMAAALDRLGNRAKRVQPLFITIDPARDTPKFLAGYVANFHPRLIGLTGTAEQIAGAAKAYRVFYAQSREVSAGQSEKTGPAAGSAEYFMDHSGFVYLMGPDGEYRTMFRRAASPQAIADTIAGFLDKSASR